jgi:hypothetical protein
MFFSDVPVRVLRKKREVNLYDHIFIRIPVRYVLEEIIINKVFSDEHLELAAGAVHGLLRHRAQDILISRPALLVDDIIVVSYHVEAPPQSRLLIGRVEPREAHESGTH